VASLAFEAPFLGIEKIVLGGKTTLLASLLNKSSFLAPALGVTKSIKVNVSVLLKSDLDVQQRSNPPLKPRANLLNISSCLAPALGVINLGKLEIRFWSHFAVPLKSDLNVKQRSNPPLWPGDNLLNGSSCLAPA
jgi:hypothetical protein